MISIFFLFAGLFGVAAGSFANVLIHRLPRRESVVSPRSHCPACEAPIPWYWNIPVLSWVFLLGRCASCKAPISLRYPLVEIWVCGLFLVSAWRWGLSAEAAAACLFGFMATVLGFIDLEHQLLPDALTYPGLAAGLAFSFVLSWTDWRSSLAGAGLGAVIPWVLLVFWSAVMKEEGMGWGDVKYLAMIGAFLGWKGALLTLVAASLLGSLVGLSGMLLRRMGRKTALPFGTFLSAAALLALFFQDVAWTWYLGLFRWGAR